MADIRALFVSDAHLGCRYADSEALLDFLQRHEPQQLYLVGDFLDGWRLKKGWFWTDTYSFIIQRIIELVAKGTQVYYCPGNHDEFLRQFVTRMGNITIQDEFVHETADGERMLVMHGDQFDTVVRHAKWLSLLGDMGYYILLKINRYFNLARRLFGFGYWSLSAYIKHRVKLATNAISNFEYAATKYAMERQCTGVICGHIHSAKKDDLDGIKYYNTGDWVESCTALVEYFDGRFEVVNYYENPAKHRVLPKRRKTNPEFRPVEVPAAV